MNLANYLTIIRFFLAPIVALLIFIEQPVAAAIIFFIAGLTDALDGIAARFQKKSSEFGQKFEALGDFFLYAAVIFPLAITRQIPDWLVIFAIFIFIFIALVIVIISKTENKFYIPHRTSIKIAAVFLFLTTFAYLLDFSFKTELVYLTLIVGIWPAVDYLIIIHSKTKIEAKSFLESIFKKKK